jgi:rhodanese-related sulfurtransferase
LVQATDQYIGTLGARVVLVDDREVRAAMTASWLRQMGWREVYVFTGSGSETGWPEPPMLGDPCPREMTISPAELAALMARNEATVIDISISRTYRDAHIPGAWFAIRARLDRSLAARRLGSARGGSTHGASGAHPRRRQQCMEGCRPSAHQG